MNPALAQSTPPSLFDLAAYDYELPPEAIAQSPAARRDEARLMVVERGSDERLHRRVSDLPDILRSGDVLVVNDTRVLPARLRGRTQSGARIETLMLRPTERGTWLALARPVKRLKLGKAIALGVLSPSSEAVIAIARVVAIEEGVVELAFAPHTDVLGLIDRCGEVPLPPYIDRVPRTDAVDRERYQTVYARVPGAIAAPTAGLHFTPELLERLRQNRIEIVALTLHVGVGTFQPVRVEDVRQHRMEPEWSEIPEATAAAIAAAKSEGRRVIAVGTTTTRALESCCEAHGEVRAGNAWANGFFVPGFQFRVVDGLLTNFHLPRSTLLMLVAAFSGRERILDAYREAIGLGYRFYSYGDATLLL